MHIPRSSSMFILTDAFQHQIFTVDQEISSSWNVQARVLARPSNGYLFNSINRFLSFVNERQMESVYGSPPYKHLKIVWKHTETCSFSAKLRLIHFIWSDFHITRTEIAV